MVDRKIWHIFGNRISFAFAMALFSDRKVFVTVRAHCLQFSHDVPLSPTSIAAADLMSPCHLVQRSGHLNDNFASMLQSRLPLIHCLPSNLEAWSILKSQPRLGRAQPHLPSSDELI